jgi:hypothetical protein
LGSGGPNRNHRRFAVSTASAVALIFTPASVGEPPSAPQCSDAIVDVPFGSGSTVALPCEGPAGVPLTRTIEQAPDHGTLDPVDQDGGTVGYLPDDGYIGTDLPLTPPRW